MCVVLYVCGFCVLLYSKSVCVGTWFWCINRIVVCVELCLCSSMHVVTCITLSRYVGFECEGTCALPLCSTAFGSSLCVWSTCCATSARMWVRFYHCYVWSFCVFAVLCVDTVTICVCSPCRSSLHHFASRLPGLVLEGKLFLDICDLYPTSY